MHRSPQLGSASGGLTEFYVVVGELAVSERLRLSAGLAHDGTPVSDAPYSCLPHDDRKWFSLGAANDPGLARRPRPRQSRPRGNSQPVSRTIGRSHFREPAARAG